MASVNGFGAGTTYRTPGRLCRTVTTPGKYSEPSYRQMIGLSFAMIGAKNATRNISTMKVSPAMPIGEWQNRLQTSAQKLLDLLSAGEPARAGEWTEEELPSLREAAMITAKPVLYVCNVGEDDVASGDNALVQTVRDHAATEAFRLGLESSTGAGDRPALAAPTTPANGPARYPSVPVARGEFERIEKQLILGQSAAGKIRPGRFDHRRRSAHIDIMAAEIFMVGQDRLMYEPGSPVPAVIGLWLGEHRREAEMFLSALPVLWSVPIVKIPECADPPIELHGAWIRQGLGFVYVPQDGLDWRITGAAGHHDHRPR